jgi:hypothetical protein
MDQTISAVSDSCLHSEGIRSIAGISSDIDVIAIAADGLIARQLPECVGGAGEDARAVEGIVDAIATEVVGGVAVVTVGTDEHAGVGIFGLEIVVSALGATAEAVRGSA